MTSARSYRVAVMRDAALEELRRCAGTQFDPEVVAVFCDEVERVPEGALESGAAA
jgi:HD-GYP domain-containing protein (c-di-GMP phosphodiesterase class II)